MGKKLEYNDVYKEFESRGCTLLSASYNGNKEKLKYIAACGHENETNFNNFINKNQTHCKDCGNKKKNQHSRVGFDKIAKMFSDKGCTVLCDNYNTTHDKIEYIAKCGHVNRISPDTFSNGIGELCPKCSRHAAAKKNKTPYSEVVQLFNSYGCEIVTTETEYKGVKQSIVYKCKCGRITQTQAYHFKNGHTQCHKCSVKYGADNPLYKKDKPIIERVRKRCYTEYGIWRKSVKQRFDGCVCCGVKEKIEVHHIENYSENENKKHDVENGITLCKKCHSEFHKQYGKSGNNLEQLQTFISHKARNDYQRAS